MRRGVSICVVVIFLILPNASTSAEERRGNQDREQPSLTRLVRFIKIVRGFVVTSTGDLLSPPRP